ncbi:CSS-motif domain-containing protein [Klebsiella pneumoniae subsp. pneumoniae]|nr:CSS-motif domain-containing protein [Klebsiella pneumoniae subsp. pneumoniae]
MQVADQAREALREADTHTAASCSPEHLLTLRRIAYTHRYIQEVLWLRDSDAAMLLPGRPRTSLSPFPRRTILPPDGYRTG